ncbi:MAG: ABC transporter permease, partial [Acidobacteriota bacterium]|nr:ABC transporter permease [Acidobacteriota bacterium]
MRTLWRDLRGGLRMVRKHPGLTLTVVLSIGLGIGVNTTVFTWMEALVLNPTPLVRDADRLVAVNTAKPDGTGIEADPFSYQTYLDWRDSARSFDGLIAHTLIRLNLRQGEETQGRPVWGEIVSGNYFDVAGVPAALGRTLTPDDERVASRVAVLSDGLWRSRFAGDPSVVGHSVLLNGADVTVVGVAPRGFRGILASYDMGLWVPVTLQPVLQNSNNRLVDRSSRFLQGTARLKPGVTLAQADAELRALALRVSQEHGETPVTAAAVRLMRQRFSGVGFYPLFSGLLGVTALVLLIACANVANLLLARASSRRKEIAVRLALGASRWRIVRQLLTESLLLSLLGGAAGLLFAFWAKDFFLVFIPPTPQPYVLGLTMSWRIVIYAFLVTMAAVLLFGLTPALRASRPDPGEALKAEGRGASSSHSRLRGALVVVQVTFSVVALVCAGLFVRSLRSAEKIEPGFADPSHLLLVGTDLNAAGLKPEEGIAAADRLLERVRQLPGVAAAGYSTMVPLGFGGHAYADTKVEGYVPAPGEEMSNERVIVGDGYFETMGIPVQQGRAITADDRAAGQRVAVINETFARRYYPGQDPIGKRIDQGQGWATVVGVAKDGKYQQLDETPAPLAYYSLRQWYAPSFTLHVRTVGPPRARAEEVRGTFAATDSNLPFLDPRTMTEHMGAATFRQFFGASMLSVFGSLALLLVALGLYGVLSYAVTQRTRELAIRVALGSSPGDVTRLVIKQGIIMTGVGLVIGTPLAVAAGRFLQSQLLGESATDPLTLVGIP